MRSSVVALVDCNSFYASCEKVFNPSLKNKPVVVLSNNDGCVVARSKEAKQVGVKMAIPIFKIHDLVKRFDIQVYSSNYALYADMSNRVMSVLSEFTPDMEVYSIDEAFLDFSNCINYSKNIGKTIHDTVERYTGIPVSVGIGPTKTLAKIANELCKKNEIYGGYLNITQCSNSVIDYYLNIITVEDIWGVGRQYSKFLHDIEIHTAKDLKYADVKQIRKRMTVMGERTIRELNGIPCIPMQSVIKPKKGIACTRAFSKDVSTLEELIEAISTYTSRACEKLRKDQSVANLIYVFIVTNRFKKQDKQYFNGISIKLPYPTSFTPVIAKYAIYCLKHIFKSGYRYKKAGIFLMGIESESVMQYDLLYPSKERDRESHTNLMNTIDLINRKWGNNTIRMASEGIVHSWGMKQNRRSPRYTTCWDELMVAKMIWHSD